MKNTKEKQIIRMKTFGCFELIYKEKSLLKGKAKESQFALLMQCLLHEKDNGVSRERLEDILFEKRDVEDRHHALQSVVYNAKKKLKAAGLPEINYIYLQEGVFYWNNEVEVLEDAREFEKMYLQALAEEDAEKKIELYQAASRLYTDEFLADFAMLSWVAQEEKRYHEMFDNCIMKCIALLEEREDYHAMIELGQQAARRVKYADYEMVVMDAMIAMGSYQDACAYYEQVEKEYSESQKSVPLAVYHRYMERLAEKIAHPLDQMNGIRKQMDIMETDSARNYTYPVFKGIYQTLRLTAKRSTMKSCLLLCTISDLSGNPLRDDILTAMDEELECGINSTIRKGDVVTKYGKGQFLVMLFNLQKLDCQSIQRRIDSKIKYKSKNSKVTYLFEEIEPYEGETDEK